MELDIYQVDAFAKKVFEGNPAAVCPLEEWLTDDIMQSIAAENNLAETAFFVPNENGFYIRWFTPTKEVSLCGHATLASAHILFSELNYQGESIVFDCMSGELIVKKAETGYEMDFPSQPGEVCDKFDEAEEIFSKRPIACLKHEDYVLVFDDEEFIRNANFDISLLKAWDLRGVMITAASTEYDFISRFFAPNYGINEDPVTGSSFTKLIPYWADKLNKQTMFAKQLSPRGGEVHCQLNNDRVLISGGAITYLKGKIIV
ncbi:PhzF family phenazine biosynthesis protein [Bermanella marisrubri]|uniref:Phenazine biosynthesis protein, PhzF family n=1 Tax=Bermanella marisrubri TaxID=207949 RepID=Q1N1E7_9GAMM|nr:PhzF family phenazine biosynthesis protein [Bermanella marisrubri]EAT12103.1 phenazine biosynthesis protein, PhzF family [Oceanobacter sp. RED65] [Bermanella marisrubri]QIZ83568.1 PhzF family phenazine biosynthesis protein [Bermanella marisrubri]